MTPDTPWTCPQRDHAEPLSERASVVHRNQDNSASPSFWDRLEARINNSPVFGAVFAAALIGAVLLVAVIAGRLP